jgi:hypothetical protein
MGRLLQVTVVEAHNIIGVESYGTASDAYARISFFDAAGQEISSESGRTAVVSGTVNPQWGELPEPAEGDVAPPLAPGETFAFGEYHDMADPDAIVSLRVALFDENTFIADIPLGFIEMPLDQLTAVHESNADGLDIWLPLHKDRRAQMAIPARGEVHLVVKFLGYDSPGRPMASVPKAIRMAGGRGIDAKMLEVKCVTLRGAGAIHDAVRPYATLRGDLTRRRLLR